MSIKLGSGTINKIFLGSTLINKAYLGDFQIYPTGSQAPVLLEGFENTVGTGGPAWSDTSGSNAISVTRTSSNVTQGSFTWRLEGAAAAFPSITPMTSANISSLVSSSSLFSVDVFAQTLNASDYVVFYLNDGVNEFFSFSTIGQTGSYTLSIDTTSITDYTNMTFAVGPVGSLALDPTNGVSDIYFDNLRAI